MRFGRCPLPDALGAILAHGTRTLQGRIAKGTLLDADALAALRAAGHREIIVARPDAQDVIEDAAALQIATALSHPSLRLQEVGTGRVNLHAVQAGLFCCDPAPVTALNSVDEAITLATLPPYTRIQAGDMVATVKIIPFAVPQVMIDQAIVAATSASAPLVQVHPFQSLRCAIVQTDLPTLKPSVAEKTVARTQARIAALGGTCHDAGRVAHDANALAAALSALEVDLIVVFGASAMCDGADVIPAAIRAAGGQVARVGMPVDPGNLLVLGQIGARHVVGAPGCARSPKENGFDWVLARLFAGLTVRNADIAAMGVGGLLTEIPSRPRPRGVQGSG